MKPRPIALDFARRRPRLNGRGAALLAVGLAAAVLVLMDYRGVAAQSAGLEWRLAALHGEKAPAKVDKATQRAEQEAAAAINVQAAPPRLAGSTASHAATGAVAIAVPSTKCDRLVNRLANE